MSDVGRYRRSTTPKQVVETGLLREVQQVTLDAHTSELSYGSIVVYTGRSRIGKTTAAENLEQKINDKFGEDDPDSYRAKSLYAGGDERRPHQRHAKRGIKLLYWQVVGAIEDRVYWRYTEDVFAEEVVKALRRKRIQMLLVDEAGTLSADELRGIVMVWDVAQRLRWPLTIVLIGMDKLPERLRRYEQVHNRIARWCYFEPYDVDEFWPLLAALSPHFARLDPRKATHRAQVECLHAEAEGIIGRVVPILSRLASLTKHAPDDEVDLEFLQAVIVDVRRGENLAIEGQRTWTQRQTPRRAKSARPATARDAAGRPSSKRPRKGTSKADPNGEANDAADA